MFEDRLLSALNESKSVKESGMKKTWEEFHKLRDQTKSLWNRKQK